MIDPDPQEFPHIDERRFGLPYRYVHAMALPNPPDPAFIGETSLFKPDLETGARQRHDFGTNHYPGEFVFVASHAGADEDEGWLIGLVINAVDERRRAADCIARLSRGTASPSEAM